MEKFSAFLKERKLSEERIDSIINLIEKFENFLNGADHLKSPTTQDIEAFSDLLIKEKLSQLLVMLTMMNYARFIKNDEIYLATLVLIDGAEALDNLYDKVGKELGEEKRGEIFAGIELPVLGSPNTKKPKITQAVMERLESAVGTEGTKDLLKDCLRNLESEWFQEGRKKYLESKDFDEFLKRKGDDFIAELTKLKEEDKLYFNQKITDEVIEYVEINPEIRQGVREGNILYEAKIPYMTIEYLAEKDEELKRYYYCHCPWARESLMDENVQVPGSFCNCSAGFHKKSWEVILDQPLKAEVLETVLDGGMWCKFAIHLPDEVVDQLK